MRQANLDLRAQLVHKVPEAHLVPLEREQREESLAQWVPLAEPAPLAPQAPQDLRVNQARPANQGAQVTKARGAFPAQQGQAVLLDPLALLDSQACRDPRATDPLDPLERPDHWAPQDLLVSLATEGHLVSKESRERLEEQAHLDVPDSRALRVSVVSQEIPEREVHQDLQDQEDPLVHLERPENVVVKDCQV